MAQPALDFWQEVEKMPEEKWHELLREMRLAVREAMEDALGDLHEVRRDLEYVRQWRRRMEALGHGFWASLGRILLLAVLTAIGIIIAMKGGK